MIQDDQFLLRARRRTHVSFVNVEYGEYIFLGYQRSFELIAVETNLSRSVQCRRITPSAGCNNNVRLIFAATNRERKIFRTAFHFAKMKNDRHNSRGRGEKKIVVYNSNGAKSSYEVCTGKIHRRVMEILCAGSCRGNAHGMPLERGGKLVSLFSSFFFSVVNRTAPGRRQRHRKPAG